MNVLKAACALAFLTLVVFLGWRESAQANLKTGARLQDKGDPAAGTVLESGSGKNPHDYQLHFRLAAELDKRALGAMNEKKPFRGPLLAARGHLLAALALRRDAFTHAELGRNYLMDGKLTDALAHFNYAFFLSQNPNGLDNWKALADGAQAKAADGLFSRGHTGLPLIMAYNSVTGFAPNPPKTSGSRFIETVLLAIPPEQWMVAGVAEHRTALAARYGALPPEERERTVSELDGAGFHFIIEAATGKQ